MWWPSHTGMQLRWLLRLSLFLLLTGVQAARKSRRSLRNSRADPQAGQLRISQPIARPTPDSSRENDSLLKGVVFELATGGGTPPKDTHKTDNNPLRRSGSLRFPGSRRNSSFRTKGFGNQPSDNRAATRTQANWHYGSREGYGAGQGDYGPGNGGPSNGKDQPDPRLVTPKLVVFVMAVLLTLLVACVCIYMILVAFAI